MKKDDLGDRMKEQYENRTRYFLPRRTYTIIRVDGKAFHTFTKGCKKPFDHKLMGAMDETAIALCNNIQGAKFAYVQSDEISVLVTDFDKIETSAWFNGNIQKIASVSASIATMSFNSSYSDNYSNAVGAMFDARVFTIPDVEEVINYFVWRQQDATRNSIQMVARALYSHKDCENKNQSDLQEMIFKFGDNWNNYPVGAKRGRIIEKQIYNPLVPEGLFTTADIRTRWEVVDPPIFTQDRNYLKDKMPRLGV